MPALETTTAVTTPPHSSVKALVGAGYSAVKDVAVIMDPYVPATQTLQYVETTAATAQSFATKQSTLATEAARGQILQAVEIKDKAVAQGLELFEKSGAKGVVGGATERVEGVRRVVEGVVEGVKARALQRYQATYHLANRVVHAAADVVLAYTPKTAVDLVNQAMQSVDAVRVDGIQGLKGRVPDYVLTSATRSYEIFDSLTHSAHLQSVATRQTIDSSLASLSTSIHTTTDQITNTLAATSQQLANTFEHKKQETLDAVHAGHGYIVSRVNGTVEYMVAVPAVKALLARLPAVNGWVVSVNAGATAAGVSVVGEKSAGTSDSGDDEKTKVSDDVEEESNESDAGLEMK
ncbi:hypothetical protein HDU98_005757 [Podochytrium sp. JEL0797]|nr:hypothetical protein HDU98_005757 [Podochytrium sp. JEL0797]